MLYIISNGFGINIFFSLISIVLRLPDLISHDHPINKRISYVWIVIKLILIKNLSQSLYIEILSKEIDYALIIYLLFLQYEVN